MWRIGLTTIVFPHSYRSDCLDDIPAMSAVIKEPREFYGKLPGQVINRDQQCAMIFGNRFYACPQRLVSYEVQLSNENVSFAVRKNAVLSIDYFIYCFYRHLVAL